MTIDLPFRDELKSARASARANIANLTDEQIEALNIPQEAVQQSRPITEPISRQESKRRRDTTDSWLNSLSLDDAVAISTANRDQDIGSAIAQAQESFAASRERLGSTGDRVLAGLSRRTGVDVESVFDANLAGVRGAVSGPAVQSSIASSPASMPDPGISSSSASLSQAAADTREATAQTLEEAADVLSSVQESQRALSQMLRDIRASISQLPNT